MTEYIVVVALVALASAAVYQNFGEVLRTQTTAMSQTLAGNDGSTQTDNAGKLAGKAQIGGRTLKTFGKSTVEVVPDKQVDAANTQAAASGS